MTGLGKGLRAANLIGAATALLMSAIMGIFWKACFGLFFLPETA